MPTDDNVNYFNQDYSNAGSDFLYDTLKGGAVNYKNNKSAAVAIPTVGNIDDFLYSDDPELNPWLNQQQVDYGPYNWTPYEVDTGLHDPNLLQESISNFTQIPIRTDSKAFRNQQDSYIKPVQGSNEGRVYDDNVETPITDKTGSKKGTEYSGGTLTSEQQSLKDGGKGLMSMANNFNPAFQYKLL